MLFTALFAVAALAAPYDPFPLKNGFPNPSAASLAKIEKTAGGTLPNGPLPKTLTAGATTALQAIAINEEFEVAYFNQLISNITSGVDGYKNVPNKKYVLRVLRAVLAQEQLHALGANGILKNAGKPTAGTCKYTFPVSTFDSAIALAATFTDVVFGQLQEFQELFATDGGDEIGLVGLVGSITAQEGEQVGWYRSLAKKVPSAAPFLTRGTAKFTLNALAQNFLVPGSCPLIPTFPLFKSLIPPSNLAAKSSNGTFTTNASGVTAKAYQLAYISGQNLPVLVPISNIKTNGGVTTFTASFPFDSGFSKGLTLSALVKKGTYTTVAAVADGAVAGPGLIEV